MGVARATERHSCDLRTDNEDTGSPVVLSQVLGEAEDRAASEATLLVHHEALDGGAEAQELGELVVGAGHVDTASGAEDQVGDLGLGLAPFLDGLGSSLFAQSRDLNNHHVLPCIQ